MNQREGERERKRERKRKSEKARWQKGEDERELSPLVA